MLTKLLLATSAIGAFSAPVANYQHTTQEGNVNITYQYETNEVNSIDDLVVGNVYHCDLDSSSMLSLSDYGYNVSFYFVIVNGSLYLDGESLFSYIDEVLTPVQLEHNQLYYTDFVNDDIYFYTSLGYEYIAYGIENISSIYGSFDFVVSYAIDYVIDDYSFGLLDHITPSSYNVITNVQEVYHTGLFGNLADFLRYYVYGGIPHVTDISFEVGNQTITMLDWLVTTTSIALAILCIFLLYHFFRWVFKLVSGLIILR